MTACSCSPGACHGGHTIDMGMPRLTEDRLRHIRDGWVTRNNETLEMAAELLALRARVIEPEADDIARDFGIQAMSIEPGASTLTTTPTTERARQLVLAMSLACGKMLDDDQAPNYVEFEVSPAGHVGYVVHVRRAGGPSPHTLRQRAEARVEELEAADREHSQLIEYLHHAHGIEIDREDDDFREWQQQYGEVTDRG